MGSEFTPVLLKDQELRELLPITAGPVRRLLSCLELALASYSAGATRQPLRNVIDLPSPGSFLFSMPASLADPPALGVKVVTGCPANAALGVPTHQATLLMFHPATGVLQAILEAGYLTELRTAAVSAISTRLLARPGARRLAVIGAGAQARSHVQMLRLLFDLEQILVWSPSPRRCEQFAADLASPVQVAGSAEAATRLADIVLLATNSATPVVESHWIAEGAHIISIGAPRPGQREMDPSLLARARIFVDSRAGALAESGDLVLGLREGTIRESQIAGELGEVISGRVPARQSDWEVTVFKSLGMAVEDVVTGWLALQIRSEHAESSTRNRPLDCEY